MIKPTRSELVCKLDLNEPVKDTEANRYPQRMFGIKIVALDTVIKARNAEDARRKLKQFIDALPKTEEVYFSNLFVHVLHEGDSAELNEGIC